MDFEVRKAVKTDMPAVYELIRELAIHEREPEAVLIQVEDLLRAGFGKQKLFDCFVAENQSEILGMALVYPRFSSWAGVTIHLEDLIVKQTHRGRGIGTVLYKKVIEYAYAKGVNRTEWVVLDWNTEAIKFYERGGAEVLPKWLTVQINRESMHKYLTIK